MEYEAVIGLETHVQLKTRSKMWCGCANMFGSPPNTNVCPVCLGMPGALPAANEEALRLAALAGCLLNCELSRRVKFDRKNYFYPDSAKNYQITQFDMPSATNGSVEFEFQGGAARVRVNRAHLEEDVGKNVHFDRHSGVDFNRAGVPLLEIVSEPDITSAGMAFEYLNALKEILQQGGVSDCDMEKGMVRCDVNVSVRPKGSGELGAKIEIKNMNSFSGARRALEYEIPRQIAVVSKGGRLVQSTRRWDDAAGVTEEMRAKEDAHDYRYFPEPDLMPFEPTDEWLAGVKARVVELPLMRKRRFIRDYQLSDDQAEIFRADPDAGRFFEECFAGNSQSAKEFSTYLEKLAGEKSVSEADAKAKLHKAIANTVIQQWRAKLAESQRTWSQLAVTTAGTVALSGSFATGEIGSSGYQKAVEFMFTRGRSDFRELMAELGLAQVSDTSAIEKICDEVITANPGPAADFKAGKAAALNFLKGRVMKLSKGKANPAVAGEILERKLRA